MRAAVRIYVRLYVHVKERMCSLYVHVKKHMCALVYVSMHAFTGIYITIRVVGNFMLVYVGVRV